MTQATTQPISLEKTVGIVGGMGPEATVDLMQRIIANTPVSDDADHLRMLVDNNPKIPSRIKALIDGTGISPAPAIVDVARGLESHGADFLVIPCNTAHYYYDDVASAVNIPVLNLLEIVSGAVAQVQPEVMRVGLLASSATRKIQLYEPWFDKHQVSVLYPEDANQDALMGLIKAVKAKAVNAHHLQALNDATQDLSRQGAQGLVIACTELSVISGQLHSELPVFDASELLAHRIIDYAKNP